MVKEYSIVFLGSNTAILEYLARKRELSLKHCFFHEKSGDPSRFITLCEVYGLPYEVVSNNKDILDTFRTIQKVELGICAGFEIISEEVFSWPKKGFINIHPSYLPCYKGANPFYYMLVNNEKEGGVSIHRVDKEIDSGVILARAKYPILFDDDISTLIDKANKLSIRLLDKYLKKILDNEIKGKRNVGGNYYPPVGGKQWIDLSMPPLKIYNLVRSQTIYGGCYLNYQGSTFYVQKASFVMLKTEMDEDSNVTSDGAREINIGVSKRLFLRLTCVHLLSGNGS